MLNDALRRRHVPVEQMILPGENHGFLLWRSWRDTYRAAFDFFERKLR